MQNDFDLDSEDFGLSPETPSVKPELESSGVPKYAPWHKPRKQWVREKQWWGSISRYLLQDKEKFVGPQTIRYFGLPGEDLLDVMYLRKNLENEGAAISIFGLNHSPESWGRAQVQLSRLLDNPNVSSSSCVVQYSFNDLQYSHATLFRKVQESGPFDIVNLDFCDNIISPGFESTRLVAIKNLVDYQLQFHPSPWMLFITTRSSKLSSSEDIFHTLYELIKGNLASKEFMDAFSLHFGETLQGKEDERTLVARTELSDSHHSKLLIVGLLKWIFQVAVQRMCDAKLTSIVCYDIEGESSKNDMISLCIKFTKHLSTTSDSSGLTVVRQAPASIKNSEPLLAARSLSKVAKMKSVDVILKDDIKLYGQMTKQKMSLLEAAGKAVVDYVDNVCALDLDSFGVSREEFHNILGAISSD